jgi:hypothetical protein
MAAPQSSLESKADLLLSDEESESGSLGAAVHPKWFTVLRRALLRALAIACLLGRPVAEIAAYLYPSAFDVAGHERVRQSAMAYLALHSVSVAAARCFSVSVVRSKQSLPKGRLATLSNVSLQSPTHCLSLLHSPKATLA